MNTRRSFLKFAGAATVAGLLPTWIGKASAASKAHVVVIGGGFGGATAAKYIRLFDPGVQVTLIDANAQHITCPFSNLVLAGELGLNDITMRFDQLAKRHDVRIVKGLVTQIESDRKQVVLADGQRIDWDRLVVSPGIDFRYDAIEGLDAQVANTTMPHAWQAGAQTTLLRQQLEAMPDGGTFILASPPNPFRCPPGPYERASLVAYYLKQHKPRSKLLILDAKSKFAKQALFETGWQKEYPGMIEWVGAEFGGTVSAVDPKTGTVIADGQRHKAAVANVIPPQKAGAIAFAADLTDDSGWCPVNPRTYESTRHPGIHVIGDAAIAGPLPKSGFAANSEGKVCAAAIVALLNEQPVPAPSWVNTCYSLVAPDYGISVAAVYRMEADKTVATAGGVSPMGGNTQAEAAYARGWYTSITQDIWGS